MFSLHRAWMGAGLGLVLLGLATGCNNDLKAKNDSLIQQNQELKTELNNEKQATAAALAQAKAADDRAMAAEAASRPPEGTGTSDILPPGGGMGTPRSRGTTVKPAESERIVIAGDVLFDSGRSTLKPAAKAELKKHVAQLKKAASIRVEGYTDSVPMKTGTNQQLSLNRANAVKAYLVGEGVSASKIKTEGLGATKFKDPKHPTAAVNRRVEIVVAQ